MMWKSLTLPWQASLEEAWAAYLAGSVPIGAVIVDDDGRIMARGRNRSAETSAEDGFLFNHTLAHAEVNALYRLRTDGVTLRTRCTLYTTTEPCPLCLGALYMSGVRRFHYASRDPYAGSANLLGTTPYLSRKPVIATGPQQPALEKLLIALYIEYDLSVRGRGPNDVRTALQALSPESVALGEELHQSGELRRLRQQRVAAEQAVNALALHLC